MRLTAFGLLVCFLILGCVELEDKVENRPVQVAAASSLQYVLPEIAAAFQKEEGRQIETYFAASGAIASQVRYGAPIDLFCSADRSWVEALLESGDVDPESVKTYAYGRLVVATALEDIELPSDLTALGTSSMGRLALSNPDLSPYGKQAACALDKAGVLETLRERTIVGENVGQVLVYVSRGDAELGLLPLPLAQHEHLRFQEVALELYQPVEQVLAIPRRARQAGEARTFVSFLTGSRGRQILRKHGFSLPREGGEQ